MGLRGSSGGGSSSKDALLMWAYEDQPIDNSVEYAVFNGGPLSALILRNVAMGRAGTIKEIGLNLNSSVGETNPLVVTVLIDSVASDATVSSILNTPGLTFETVSVHFDADEELVLKVDNLVNVGGTRIMNIYCRVEWDD